MPDKMADDLIERLEYADKHSIQKMNGSNIFSEAAERIKSLEAQLQGERERCAVEYPSDIIEQDEASDDFMGVSIGTHALRWYSGFDWGAPHSNRESNFAAQGFKAGMLTVIKATAIRKGEDE